MQIKVDKNTKINEILFLLPINLMLSALKELMRYTIKKLSHVYKENTIIEK